MSGLGPKVPDVATLGARQHGVVTHAQLLELGVSAGRVESWVRRGRLFPRYKGVYAVGRPALGRHGAWLAAVWACGDGAVLSHVSAAELHRMVAATDGAVHVTTTRDLASRPGLVVHRTRHLDPQDVVTLGRLPVTRQPRTLVDLADVLSYPELRGIADGLRRLDLDAVAAAQRRAPNRRGAARVARVLASDRMRTRSAFERRYLRFCTTHRLPRPDATNVMHAGHEVDALYTAARLAVELDGRAHHDRRAHMRQDRAATPTCSSPACASCGSCGSSSTPTRPPRRRNSSARCSGPERPPAPRPCAAGTTMLRPRPRLNGRTGVPSRAMDLEELRRQVADGTVETVVLAMTDMQGRLQGKRLHAAHFLDEVLDHGAEACNYLLAVDVEMNPAPGFALASWDAGYGDFALVPDLGTLRDVPWHPGSVIVLADVRWHDGSDVKPSPRQVLRGQLARLAERGWQAHAASDWRSSSSPTPTSRRGTRATAA